MAKKKFLLVICLFLVCAFVLTVSKSQAQSKRKPVVEITSAVAAIDLQQGMLVTTIDAQGIRNSGVNRVEDCLGELPSCYNTAVAPLPLGNGNLVVSTQLGDVDDLKKFSAQQFTFHYDITSKQFTFLQAQDGPAIPKAVALPNCYFMYQENSKTTLSHGKTKGGENVQFVGNRYNIDTATAGSTHRYFPTIGVRNLVGCLGNADYKVEIVSNVEGSEVTYQMNYVGKDKVIESLTLPKISTDAILASVDMTYRYESGKPIELLAETWVLPTGTDTYATRIAIQPIQVGTSPWEAVGNPIPITKARNDHLYFVRVANSVRISPPGDLLIYNIPFRNSSIVKSQRLDPDTIKKIGSPHTVFKSSLFKGEVGPYGLALAYNF